MMQASPGDHEINQTLLRGSRGVVFSKRAPLAAGGKKVISWQEGRLAFVGRETGLQ
jgi:hypothetical protein